MSPLATGLVGFVILLVLIALRAPVGLALVATGFVGLWVLHGLDTALFALGTEPVATLNGYTLSVLPLFLLMGSFAVRAGLSEGLFKAANAFVGHRRGGLAMASVVACGGFGAVCGSSLATVTTMAKISIPEMLRYDYSPKLAAGSIAAGGTLGILIPPSLVMIIYAFLTETSVGKLFAAGIIPGAIATLLYVIAVMILMRFRPEIGPAGAPPGLARALRALRTSGAWSRSSASSWAAFSSAPSRRPRARRSAPSARSSLASSTGGSTGRASSPASRTPCRSRL